MPDVGEIWFIDFGPSRPREPAFSRPAIILAPADRTAWGSDQMLTIPLTSTVRDYQASLRIEATPTNGLTTTSYAQIDLMRCLPLKAFSRRLGYLDFEPWLHLRHLTSQYMGYMHA